VEKKWEKVVNLFHFIPFLKNGSNLILFIPKFIQQKMKIVPKNTNPIGFVDRLFFTKFEIRVKIYDA
jgi:hypothetical protein